MAFSAINGLVLHTFHVLEPKPSHARNEIKRNYLSGTCGVRDTILACYSCYLYVPRLAPECTVHSCIKR